jgi:hypothetical protein
MQQRMNRLTGVHWPDVPLALLHSLSLSSVLLRLRTDLCPSCGHVAAAIECWLRTTRARDSVAFGDHTGWHCVMCDVSV